MVRATVPRKREEGAGFRCKTKDGDADLDGVREELRKKEVLTTEPKV